MVGIVGSIFEWRGRFFGWIGQKWAKTLLSIGAINYSVHGLENLNKDSNYVFASNHESALDILLVFAGLPYHIVFISKIELKRIPLFGLAMIAGGHFFVDRSNHKKSMESLDKAKDSMKKTPRSIILYPEGTRSIDGSIQSFKKGGLVMAMNMGVPVVPIAMCGTSEAMPRNGLKLIKYPLELRIGTPIETSEIKYEERNEFVHEVRNSVIKLKSEWYLKNNQNNPNEIAQN